MARVTENAVIVAAPRREKNYSPTPIIAVGTGILVVFFVNLEIQRLGDETWNTAMGWRWMFDWCGAVGLVYAVPLFLMLRNAPARADRAAEPRTSPGGALRELLGNLSFILLVLYFTLPAMAKSDLFRSVILDGALPRKTFSMGEAHEKRFYVECRKL